MQLAKALREEADALCDQLKPKKVKDLSKVATISAGDAGLGKLIAEAVETVGDGSVLVEPSQNLDTELKFVEGFKIDSGYMSSNMITDPNTGRAVYENTPLLIFNSHLNDGAKLINLLQEAGQSQINNIVIIADDIPQEILARLTTLRIKAGFNCLAIKSPGFGQHRQDLLEDISAITGAKVLKEHTDLSLDNLGKIKRIVTDHESTIITGEPPKERIEQLRSELISVGDFNKERLNNRIASLEGKIATIYVGGNSETEVNEKVFRVDDAVYAAQAAQEEGILPGGGISYAELETSDTPAGKLFRDALIAPFKQLMENAGLDSETKLEQLNESKPGTGFDILNPEEPVDLIKAGIVDAAKVVRMAIKTSASVAAQVITMGGLIADQEEKDEA
jgi:chaperonin GroEL